MSTGFFNRTLSKNRKSLPAKLDETVMRPEYMTTVYNRVRHVPEAQKELPGVLPGQATSHYSGRAQGAIVMVEKTVGGRTMKVPQAVINGVMA